MKINVFKNFTLKLVALVLAIIIWFLVVGEKRSEVRLTVPLELRNLPTNLEIIESISQVEVTLRGFSSFVKNLTPSDLDVHIDLSNVVRGTNSFVISPDDITVPVGASVMQVSPSSIEVLLDATVRHAVPIEPITRGEPADGYILGDITVTPAKVNVTGAQSLLKSFAKIETEMVVLSNASQGFSKKVKVKLPNNSLRIEKDEDKVVTVNVNIVPETIDRFFEDIPLIVKNETRSFTLSPDSVTALVHGPKLALLEMTPADIAATIDTTSLPDGQSVAQVTFALPDTMDVKIYYPKRVMITLSPRQ